MTDVTGKVLAENVYWQSQLDDDIAPISYDDNYITVFPRETRMRNAIFDSSLLAGHKPALRLEGYDVEKQVTRLTAEAVK
jgi:Ig-like domain-containing protein